MDVGKRAASRQRRPKYQLFDSLRPEEYAALEKDILARGVQVAVEVDENGDVLDGYNRVEIAQRHGLKYKTVTRRFKTEGAKREHVLKLNLVRRHLAPHQWGAAFKRLLKERGIKRGKPGPKLPKSADTPGVGGSVNIGDVAAELGVPESTAYDRMKAADEVQAAPKKVQKEIATSDKPASTIVKKHKAAVKEAEKAKARKQRAREAKAGLKGKGDQNIFHGDFREKAALLADGSVELIFTDPPYDRDSLPLYGDLAEVAARVLCDGGSLVCYLGQYQMGEVFDLIRPHLRFWWPLAIQHTGTKARMREYGVVVHWKPLLWFVKGTRGDKQTFVDDLVVSEEEKDTHDWQQSLKEAEYYIQRLSPVNGLVFDPFVGGGTTLVAAKRLGRQWMGCEKNKDHAEIARKRVSDAKI